MWDKWISEFIEEEEIAEDEENQHLEDTIITKDDTKNTKEKTRK